MPRARQRHVQQPQLLALPLFLCKRHLGVARGEHEFRHAVRARQPQHGLLAAVHVAEVRRKGQQHQRVLQALGLVDGHDLHQVRVALQPQHQLVAAGQGGVAIGELLAEPTDQRLFTFHLRAGSLQQLGQVQHVGQAAFAARSAHWRQQPRRQAQHVQCAAQHGQHALRLPHGVQRLQQFALAVEALVVGGQQQQLVQRQAQQRRGQRCTRQAHVARRGHGPQQPQQVGGFIGLEHGVLVGQVDRRQPTLAQRQPHGVGFGAGTHQHRHVRRAQAAKTA